MVQSGRQRSVPVNLADDKHNIIRVDSAVDSAARYSNDLVNHNVVEYLVSIKNMLI